jgi:hypothetical protein
MKLNEIAFFEADADQNVGGHPEHEREVSERHRRRRPEGQ